VVIFAAFWARLSINVQWIVQRLVQSHPLSFHFPRNTASCRVFAAMKQYNPFIHIEPKEGMKLQDATAMTPADGNEFIEHITKCLDRLQQTAAGRKVVADIVASGHVCTIFAAPASLTTDQNICAKNPPTLQNDIAAQPKPFRPRHKHLPYDIRQMPGVVDKFKVSLEKLGERYKKAAVAPELKVILDRAQARFANPILEVSRRAGIGVEDVYDMFTGTKAIDEKTYFTICFVFYDFLTPGAGCNTSIRFQTYDSFKAEETFKKDFAGLEIGALETKRKIWRNLMAVVLGHELIHAWRIMIGKRLVFANAWEEEAMTTGVGPFMNWTPTENTLRQEFKMPLRTTYQSKACASTMMQDIMVDVNSGKVVSAF